jgi:hypothetical protein
MHERGQGVRDVLWERGERTMQELQTAGCPGSAAVGKAAEERWARADEAGDVVDVTAAVGDAGERLEHERPSAGACARKAVSEADGRTAAADGTLERFKAVVHAARPAVG